MRLLLLAAAPLASIISGSTAQAAPAADPTCAGVRTAFTSGSFDSREAIVDALQDRVKANNGDKPLGRDGKVQAIVMAVMRCEELGHGNFMAALDRTSAQVEAERAQHQPGR